MGSNYADALTQLHAAGLLVDSLQIGRMTRVRVEGDREKRGWYMVHELPNTSGDLLIVGSYGVWHGTDNGATKITISKADEFTKDQRESLRRRLAEDRKQAQRMRAAEAARAADVARKAWARYALSGESEYLDRKGVRADPGARFTKAGSVVLPLMDAAGKIHGLQFIRTPAQAAEAKRPRKEFWPRGVVKKGHFHLVGVPGRVILVAEGYATALSLHMSTQLPVVVAFDAGNLAPVCAAVRKRYKAAKLLICADDDSFTDGNPGLTAASTAAMEVDGAVLKPAWSDPETRQAKFDSGKGKLTDFNDVHAVDGLAAVRDQVEARLTELGWIGLLAPKPRVTTTGGGGSAPELRPIADLDELLERFALVYAQGGTVFDRQEHCLLSVSDMRDACIRREIHREWSEHPERAMVRVREVGFDPGGEDPSVTCNLWGGWPTEPVAGECSKLLELLRYMCAAETQSEELYQWVLKWVAYPIQHPGAKLKSTLVIHGKQGTGKNLFFEALMVIYGHYGRVIDQSAIEDRFNDWASRKLFLIADEVVARADLYHVKNKLKAFITGEWIRINPKNMAAYDERNHVNMVFLSNEAMPVVLEEDDRRHGVIWTPEKLGPEVYAGVLHEIANGGIAALHHHLLGLDLGDFGPGSVPPFTDAKAELINLSLDSTSRFYYELTNGDVGGIVPRPALSRDIYELYKVWCARTGARPAPEPKLINAFARKHDTPSLRKRYLKGQAMAGPHGVMMFGFEPEPGTAETTFLGNHIEIFRDALKDYRGAEHG